MHPPAWLSPSVLYCRRVGVYFCVIGFLSLCQTLVYLIFQKSSRKKDKEKQTCKGCNESFNFTKRKHHCKSCGAVSTDRISASEMKGHGERAGAAGGHSVQAFIWLQLCPSAGHLRKVFKDFGQQDQPGLPRVLRSKPQPGEPRRE